eukprot:CAMPEP_0119380900 /NCGR_PEP_ID=MMETSP1334-20130426/58444_1 /TAXON_ID=127549 /ORGANISM="Calcidiscus leptoporus, Strain RCC1130" /LENGTH=48 /DNA_ID= /DNA_START= /DNA_END= /DNA_ORIENTATION=
MCQSGEWFPNAQTAAATSRPPAQASCPVFSRISRSPQIHFSHIPEDHL